MRHQGLVEELKQRLSSFPRAEGGRQLAKKLLVNPSKVRNPKVFNNFVSHLQPQNV